MKNTLLCIPVIALWAVLTLGAWFLPKQAESDSERRPLAQFPELTVKTLLSGSFMDTFEDYTLDQFPLRDSFRTLKAVFHTGVMGQKDSNGIYLHNGYAAKMEYPLNETSLKHALSRLSALRDKYLQDSNVYMAVVPDKNYYLSQESGRLAMDYDRLYEAVEEGMPWAEHIDLRDTLSFLSYYRTDTHWRQDALLPAAGKICQAMGVTAPESDDFEVLVMNRPFYGVYRGQSALPMRPDSLCLLNSELLSSCTVYDHETGKTSTIYNMEKTDSRDLYDVYLSGARALLTVENPMGDPDKELIVFRDSFGSSLIPLLLQDYGTVHIVDIRYIGTDLLENFIDFHGQDVLMLYSTLILNSSSAMK